MSPSNDQIRPALSMRGVIKDYPRPQPGWRALFGKAPKNRALDGLDLEVPAGTVHILLGPNGSGKSSCLKLLCGLLLADEGTIEVDGCDVGKQPTKARRHIGLVTTTQRSFYWRVSVRHNLHFFGALQDLRTAEVDTRISELDPVLDLNEFIDAPFQSLSTGQRARVALTRALLHRPKVLLLDEVTNSLDPGVAQRVRLLLRDQLAHQDGVAVLLATHHLDEARQLGDAITVLERGVVAASGSWDDVSPTLDRVFLLEEGS